ncbi:MAG: glycosyltransferase [Alphaproteobacteria bacterium]|nr:glycosyltransferase [Alphaproteobacteria bacterium]
MKTRVAFCIPDMVIGGVETVFINTLNELIRRDDIEITVVTHNKIREKQYAQWFAEHPGIKLIVYRPLSNWFEDLQKYCKIFPLKQIRKIAFSLYKKYRRVLWQIRKPLKKVDVVIDYKSFEFHREIKLFKQPKIVWAHSAISFFQKSGKFERMGTYDKIVAITDDFVNEFKKLYPEHAHKVVRIYNPIDVTRLRQLADDAECPSGKYFCHVSRLTNGKDIKTLIDAFDIFAQKNQNINLYIIGDGKMATVFQEYAKQKTSQPQIIFTGAKENPYGYMRGAIANILSSEFEGLPTVLIESMALGTPTISSNCKSGPQEIFENGKSGYLFNVGNAQELAQQMQFVLDNPGDTDKTIKNATASLVRFAPTNIAEQIVNLIKSM